MTTQNLPAVPTTREFSILPVEVELAEVREQRKPWVAMGLLLIAASAERMIATAADVEIEALYGTATTAFVLAVVIGSRSRHRVMGKHLRRRFIASVWGAAGWLTYVAAMGMSWGAAATLTAVGSLLSLLFWREHRVHGRAPNLNLSTVGDDNLYVKRWKENLGGKGKKFEGSRLTQMEIIRSGYRYTLELVPGTHTVEGVMAEVARLRSGLQLMPGQEIIIELHPELPSPAALLTIVTKSTIRVDQRWPGPGSAWDAQRGSVVMGPFADGEGVALFSVYRKDGMFGGFVQGGIGSGKSRGVETIALACASSVSHPTTIWFACGQDGASSPLLMDKADATATTPEDLLLMLEAAIQVGRINGIENRQKGQRGFHPTADRPGLLIIIDEFHNFLDQEALGKMAVEIQMRMAKIIREFRKAGVALLLSTQDPLLTSFGPGKRADVMRSNLLVGNGVMMRSESNQPKQVFKVDINPRDFPELPGYGYLARPFPGDRQAPFRFYYVDDNAIEQWASSFTWRSLSANQASMAAKFAGSWYADRHTLQLAHHAEEAELLRQLATGEFSVAVTNTAAMDRTAMPADFDALLGGDIPDFDEIMKGWKKAPAGTHEPSSAERSLGDGHQKVLSAIAAGADRPASIMEATGLGKTRVHEVLKELVALGRIEQPTGYATYRLRASQKAS